LRKKERKGEGKGREGKERKGGEREKERGNRKGKGKKRKPFGILRPRLPQGVIFLVYS
jgi:hypothetical protein